MRTPRMLTSFAYGALAVLALAGTVAVADEAATIRASLAKVLPEYTPTSVQPTQIDGLYQVEIGPQVMFVTEDGRYLIDGAIVDLESRENITETARGKARLRAIDGIGQENMVVFKAPDERHSITVFTDIDCGYCRKLHEQMAGYEEAGISVRYLFYPRSGVGSPSYDKAVAVWCADDRQAAMTRAKSGAEVNSKACRNPVQQHMELGELMGIRGTPAIVLDNGEMVPGYVEPKRLAALLEQGVN
ncbi:thioredoxin fold domain-containing protein [Thiohalocapsa marina]|uniref:Thiol:disulfide interchange protein n=1 Tax=Thiohalocapsa marina TaxID=424902 RepID=A0A5M8FLI1_9GAMM|nr:thioredoxin fold domain-containing protein [Thiohalocapsa marina]KAA6184860.1 thioredoxin fold domain-containing protein [Thiohalocapsa marina]